MAVPALVRRFGWRLALPLILIVGAGLALWFWRPGQQPWSGYRWTQMQHGAQVLHVVVADTPAAVARGLSYQSALNADGMLFVLPARSTPVFWMFAMQFPLDFVWIDDGEIVDLHENIPAPSAGEEPMRVRPNHPVTHVLEVPAGFVRMNQWKIGDTLIIQ